MKEYQKEDHVSKVEEGEPFMKTFSSKEEADMYNLKRNLELTDIEKFRLF
jgi:hypothetical protein